MKLYKFVLDRDGVATHLGMEATSGNAAICTVDFSESRHYPTLDELRVDNADAKLIWSDPEVVATHRHERRVTVEPVPDSEDLTLRHGRSVSECLDCGRAQYTVLGAYRCEFAAEPALA